MKAVHEFNLFVSCCPLFGGPGSEELPCTHLTRLFMRQPEHFAKLPTGKTKMTHYSFIPLHSGRQQHGCLRLLHFKTHLQAQLLVHIVVVGHLVIGVDGYYVIWCRLLLLLHYLCIQRKYIHNDTYIKYIESSETFKLPTYGSHLDRLGFLAWFTNPCWVVGSDAEAVLSQRLQARLDVVGRAFTTCGDFSPASWLTQALRLHFHYVPLHCLASVIAGTRPGQDQWLARQLGNNWLGCWRVRSVCRKLKLCYHNKDIQEKKVSLPDLSTKIFSPMTLSDTVWLAEPSRFRTTTV